MAFDVEPSMINEGDYANLSWVVLSASSVTIDNGIGSVALTGHRMIQPTQTTTYILTASNATITKNATVAITVRPAQQIPEQNRSLLDPIGDVFSVDYFTQQSSAISSHIEIDVYNIDIYKVTYRKDKNRVYITLQVRGFIENRGKTIDLYDAEYSGALDYVEYDFQISTSEHVYTIRYVNQTGEINTGLGSTNLTKGQFFYARDTLEISFLLSRVGESISNVSAKSMFLKAHYVGGDLDPSGVVYLSDVCPNPSLEIAEAYAQSIGSVGESIGFQGRISPLAGLPSYRYHWDFGDGGSSPLLNPTHIYTEVGSYTYTFTVTDQAGDTDSKSGTITIT